MAPYPERVGSRHPGVADGPSDGAPLHTTIVITAKPIELTIGQLDTEVFTRTLFGRDDQLLHVFGAGINAGQHEGGGKSLEIRQFGFTLDHAGMNGGFVPGR